MNCEHPDPALCARLGRHIHGRLWELWNTSPEHRAKWEREATRVPLACVYRGDEVPGPHTDGKRHSVCSHPEKPQGVNPCICRCNTSCRGYTNVLPPWLHDISVCIPHLDTPEQLELGVALWRLQTIRPYILVIDTGSAPETLKHLESLRGPDLEVHALQAHPQRHPSCNVSVALDLAHGLCRTEHLFHTHTDVFPRRQDFLEWITPQTTAATPVVGWRMSPRDQGEWKNCVSHTATCIHIPTARRLGLSWSLDAYLDEHPEEESWRRGWPDTESGFRMTMSRAGIEPAFLGDDDNHKRAITPWYDHSRSYTCVKRWVESGGASEDTPHWVRAQADMGAAESEARERLKAWRNEL